MGNSLYNIIAGILLIIILAAGAILRIHTENKPHYDDAAIYGAIEHMLETDSFDPNFYNHPNHTGIYLYTFMFRSIDFFTFSDSFASNLQDERAFFVQIGHAVTKSIGVLEIGLAFLVGLQFNVFIGLLYAFFIALFPELIWRSDDLRPDVLFNMLYTATTLVLIRFWKVPSNKNIIASCIFIALLTATKYPGILLTAPLLIAIFLKAPNKAQSYLFAFISLAISLFVAMPYVFIQANTVIEMLSYEARDSHSNMQILGFFGNVLFYIQNFTKQTSIALLPFVLLGALQAKKYRELWIPIFTSSLLCIGLSVMSLHWSRWGLPYYSSWLLLASVGIFTLYSFTIKQLFKTK